MLKDSLMFWTEVQILAESLQELGIMPTLHFSHLESTRHLDTMMSCRSLLLSTGKTVC